MRRHDDSIRISLNCQFDSAIRRILSCAQINAGLLDRWMPDCWIAGLRGAGYQGRTIPDSATLWPIPSSPLQSRFDRKSRVGQTLFFLAGKRRDMVGQGNAECRMKTGGLIPKIKDCFKVPLEAFRSLDMPLEALMKCGV